MKLSVAAASNLGAVTGQSFYGKAIELEGAATNQDTFGGAKALLESGCDQLLGAPAGYLASPKPAYPKEARKRKQEGVVLLTILVSEKGLPSQIRLMQGSGFDSLDEAAVAAVKKWRFTPARRGETPVPSHVEVPIIFRLWTQLDDGRNPYGLTAIIQKGTTDRNSY